MNDLGPPRSSSSDGFPPPPQSWGSYPPTARPSAGDTAPLPPLVANELARDAVSEVDRLAHARAHHATQRSDLLREDLEVTGINRRMAAVADRLTGPTEQWPGGWVLEATSPEVSTTPNYRHVEQHHIGDVAIPARPDDRYRPVYRTRDGADAAIPAAHRDQLRAGWVAYIPDPAGGTWPDLLMLHAGWWARQGAPRVAAENHVARFGPDDTLPRTYRGQTYTGHEVLLAVPGAEVLELAEQYAPIFADQPALARVPADWLHLTLWSGPSAQPLERLIDEVAVAMPPAFEVEVGPATVNSNGLQLDVHPDGLLRTMMQVVRSIAFPDDPGPVQEDHYHDRFWRPHIALGYTTADTTVDYTGINHIRRRARWRVDTLLLVAQHRDTDRGFCHWDVLDRIAL